MPGAFAVTAPWPGVTATAGRTNAPIATQGAQFAGSTFGYEKIKVSFDVYATADAEANLLVQYTTDGSTWNTAAITSGGTAAASLKNNTSSASTATGLYVKLASGWNNQIMVDLSGVSGVDNDASFAIRLVNASTGADCVDTTGHIHNNTSGSWTFDNVVIQGASIDNIAAWEFDTLGTVAVPYNNPPATLGYGSASVLGMNNSYNGTTEHEFRGCYCAKRRLHWERVVLLAHSWRPRQRLVNPGAHWHARRGV